VDERLLSLVMASISLFHRVLFYVCINQPRLLPDTVGFMLKAGSPQLDPLCIYFQRKQLRVEWLSPFCCVIFFRLEIIGLPIPPSDPPNSLSVVKPECDRPNIVLIIPASIVLEKALNSTAASLGLRHFRFCHLPPSCCYEFTPLRY